MSIGRQVVSGVALIRRRYATSDRSAEYARLLRLAVDAGYALVALTEFEAQTRQFEAGTRQADAARPRLIALRHDVDIRDVGGNQAFYELELAAGARSTFYFRWTTAPAHRRLIERLVADGFEVGYHYEEAATVAKRHALRDRASVEAHREEVETLMRRRAAEFRRKWSPGLCSAASHGDWMNRRLGIVNHELVTASLLADCGLSFEAYGEAILGRADVYVSDVGSASSAWSRGYGLADAIADAHPWICVLTHERRWHTNRAASLGADLRRAGDEARYLLRAAVAPLLRREPGGSKTGGPLAGDRDSIEPGR